MPIYSFRCLECGYEINNIILPIDHEEQVCPECEDDGLLTYVLEKPPSVHFEGGGWTPGAGLDRRK